MEKTALALHRLNEIERDHLKWKITFISLVYTSLIMKKGRKLKKNVLLYDLFNLIYLFPFRDVTEYHTV